MNLHLDWCVTYEPPPEFSLSPESWWIIYDTIDATGCSPQYPSHSSAPSGPLGSLDVFPDESPFRPVCTSHNSPLYHSLFRWDFIFIALSSCFSLSILRPVADELALSYGNRIVGESVRRPSGTSVLTSVKDFLSRQCAGQPQIHR